MLGSNAESKTVGPPTAAKENDGHLERNEQGSGVDVVREIATTPAGELSTPATSLEISAPTIQLVDLDRVQQTDLQVGSEQVPNDGVSAQQPKAESSGTGNAMDKPEIEKRKTDTPAEQRPSKKPRIEIDLTLDDDDDVVLIKEEVELQSDVKAQIDAATSEEEDELQAQLDEVLRQEREVHLERRKAELQRKIKAARKKFAGPVLKTEDIIKLKD